MILLDTHILVWYLQGDDRLTDRHRYWLKTHENDGLAVSILSCWEISKLVEYGRLVLPVSLEAWFEVALSYPGIHLVDLSVPIAVQSTRLKKFHKDPADQIIAATAIVLGIPLLTADRKLIEYAGVVTLQ